MRDKREDKRIYLPVGGKRLLESIIGLAIYIAILAAVIIRNGV